MRVGCPQPARLGHGTARAPGRRGAAPRDRSLVSVTDDVRSGVATRLIGAHVKRFEDPRLLTGRGRYLDDIRLPGLIHAAFVRSPHAHACLTSVDLSAALGGAEVVAALAGRELAGKLRPLAPRLEAEGFAATAWPALADSRVRFVGEPVAVVAAVTPYAAADAGEQVVARYEPLVAAADLDAALAPGSPRLHDEVPGNVLFEKRFSQGDVEGTLARATV